MEISLKRLERLLHIILKLQTRTIITGEQLADDCRVSLRTIYRDLKALQNAGFPIYAEAKVGYSLNTGYLLPPMNFTAHEINALITVEKVIKKNSDSSLYHNYLSALEKIKVTYKAKEDVEILEKSISPSLQKNNFSSRYLGEAQLAITKRRVLFLFYSSLSKGEETERRVDPLAVYFTDSNWILIAWCHLRKELREFRTDRIIKMHVLDEVYEPRSFDFEKYFKKQSML